MCLCFIRTVLQLQSAFWTDCLCTTTYKHLFPSKSMLISAAKRLVDGRLAYLCPASCWASSVRIVFVRLHLLGRRLSWTRLDDNLVRSVWMILIGKLSTSLKEITCDSFIHGRSSETKSLNSNEENRFGGMCHRWTTSVSHPCQSIRVGGCVDLHVLVRSLIGESNGSVALIHFFHRSHSRFASQFVSHRHFRCHVDFTQSYLAVGGALVDVIDGITVFIKCHSSSQPTRIEKRLRIEETIGTF